MDPLEPGYFYVETVGEYLLCVGSILIILFFCLWIIKIIHWISIYFKVAYTSPLAGSVNESGNLSDISQYLSVYGSNTMPTTHPPPPYEPPPPYCIAIAMRESSVRQEELRSYNQRSEKII